MNANKHTEEIALIIRSDGDNPPNDWERPYKISISKRFRNKDDRFNYQSFYDWVFSINKEMDKTVKRVGRWHRETNHDPYSTIKEFKEKFGDGAELVVLWHLRQDIDHSLIRYSNHTILWDSFMKAWKTSLEDTQKFMYDILFDTENW